MKTARINPAILLALITVSLFVPTHAVAQDNSDSGLLSISEGGRNLGNLLDARGLRMRVAAPAKRQSSLSSGPPVSASARVTVNLYLEPSHSSDYFWEWFRQAQAVGEALPGKSFVLTVRSPRNSDPAAEYHLTNCIPTEWSLGNLSTDFRAGESANSSKRAEIITMECGVTRTVKAGRQTAR